MTDVITFGQSGALSRRAFVAGGGVALATLLLPAGNALAVDTPPNEMDITLGQTVTHKKYEFTLTEVAWRYQIAASNTEGTYARYDSKDGKPYFVVKGTYEHLGTHTREFWKTSKVSFTFNGSYQYDGEIAASPVGSTKIGHEADPLDTVEVSLYASVPEKLREQFESVEVEWQLWTNFADDADAYQYALVYTQADADAAADAARKAEEEAAGRPVSALSLGGLRVEIPEDMHAFQLADFVSRAYTADLGTAVVVSVVDDASLPSPSSKAGDYLYNWVATAVASVGGSITETRSFDVEDGMPAYVSVGTYNEGQNRSVYIDVPTGAGQFTQVEISQTQMDGVFDDAFVSLIEQGIKKRGDGDDEGSAPANTEEVEVAGIRLGKSSLVPNADTGANTVASTIDGDYAVRWFDFDRMYQIYIERYVGWVTPHADAPDCGYCPNTFSYAGGYAPSDPAWAADYAQLFAAAKGGTVIGSRVIERDGVSIEQHVTTGWQSDGFIIYVLDFVSHPDGVPTVVTMRCAIAGGRAFGPAADATTESIVLEEDAAVSLSMSFHVPMGWSFYYPGNMEEYGDDPLTGLSSWRNWTDENSSFWLNEATLYRMNLEWDDGTLFLASYGATLLSQWWQNCANTTVCVNDYTKEDSSGGMDRGYYVAIPVSNGNSANLQMDCDERDFDFFLPLMNQIVAYIEVSL